MTIDKLAEMIMRGFNEVNGKISLLSDRIDKIELRLDAVKARMDAFDVKLDERFDTLSRRIDDLALGKVSRQEHLLLSSRVLNLEKGT